MENKIPVLTNDSIDLHRLEMWIFFWLRDLFLIRDTCTAVHHGITLRQTNVRFATNFNFLVFCRPKTRQTTLNIYLKANTSQIASLL